jgi:hypothetical protein
MFDANTAARFWQRVSRPDRRRHHCWLWTGGKDSEGYGKLARQSFTLAGFIILITGIPYIGDTVFRKYDSFFFFFFDIRKFLLGFLPTLFPVIAGLFFLYCGKDREHMKS